MKICGSGKMGNNSLGCICKIFNVTILVFTCNIDQFLMLHRTMFLFFYFYWSFIFNSISLNYDKIRHIYSNCFALSSIKLPRFKKLKFKYRIFTLKSTFQNLEFKINLDKKMALWRLRSNFFLLLRNSFKIYIESIF